MEWRLDRVAMVALGAAFGANSRYWIGLWIHERMGLSFPFGTLFVNVSGSFALGILTALTVRVLPLSTEWRLLLGTGFLGSYTTFSTFAVESISLLEEGRIEAFFFNAATNTLLSLLAAAAGFWLVRTLS